MSVIHCTERQCEQCGKPFTPTPVQINRGKGKCCSLSCAASKPRRLSLADRFFAKVNKTESCWLWTGSQNSYGYGMLWTGKRKTLAHRVSWELHNGPIPDGLCALHDCPTGDNPLCVNPRHLWLGTKSENGIDRAEKGRNADQAGEKNNGAILTTEQVIEIRARHAAGGITQTQLAREHGVQTGTINQIILRKNWRHL